MNKNKENLINAGTVSSICKEGTIASPDDKLISLYDKISFDKNITEISVVDEDGIYLGKLTKSFLLKKFGGRYGYSLSSNRLVKNYMDKVALVVEHDTLIEEAAKLSMERDVDNLYDSIPVLKYGRYLGIVSIKRLLNAVLSIKVKKASSASPLTGLPGNVVIEEEVSKLLASNDNFSVIYLDLDNFKAYNDAYGFNNGDLMIKAVAKAMIDNTKESDFLGHIGGDDFVILTRNYDVVEMCKCIVKSFKCEIKPLYDKKDWEKGEILSKNRGGFIESFPVATLSIAVIRNKKKDEKKYDVKEFSVLVAKTKKRAKKEKGNSLVIV